MPSSHLSDIEAVARTNVRDRERKIAQRALVREARRLQTLAPAQPARLRFVIRIPRVLARRGWRQLRPATGSR